LELPSGEQKETEPVAVEDSIDEGLVKIEAEVEPVVVENPDSIGEEAVKIETEVEPAVVEDPDSIGEEVVEFVDPEKSDFKIIIHIKSTIQDFPGLFS
jgi:hypothetical protein